MSFLSDRHYREFLDERIGCLDDVIARDHVRKTFDRWREQYLLHRLLERISELLAGERTRPNMLYLGCEADLELLSHLARRHHFDARLFRGFLVADRLWNQIKPEWFAPFPVYRTSQWQDRENTVVFSLSLAQPFRKDSDDRGNDYLERFIDPDRLTALEKIRQQCAERRIVLYVDYRRVQTLAALSEQIRRQSDLATVLLVNAAPASSRREFDAVFEEPFSYLWPLAFERLHPDVYHVNVGWGTQGLPFAPFLPREAVIDFYDLLTSVADEALNGLHPEPLALTRASERTLLGGFGHIVHRCSDDITDALRAAYPGRDIVAVTEYLREPVYTPEPARRDGTIRLVYGGLLVRGDATPDDPHYKNFMQMVKFYCHENLHLHLYPSPYLYGFEAPRGLEELIRRLNLDHVHACMPREDNDFVREIAQYDFGLCIPTPEEVRPTSYGYILPGKIIAYLRAGLPILVPEDQTFVADLVREHGIGVVYGYDDHQRMAELLNGQDLDQLKRNVVRFREQFRIEKGAGKVLRLYESALEMRDSAGSAPSGRPRRPCEVSEAASLAELLEKLDREGYLGASEYEAVLRREVDANVTGAAQRHVASRLAGWLEMYDNYRCLSRLLDRIRSLNGTPYLLYVDDPSRLDLLVFFLQEIRRLRVAPPAGFVAASHADVLQARLAPAKVLGVMEPSVADHLVVCFSKQTFPGNARQVIPNDYRDRFIEARRFDDVRRVRQTHQGKQTVLYPMYREIHTIAMVARHVGRTDEGLRTISLSPRPLMRTDFDATLVEPFLCLWPLIFRMLDPDLVHLNVGWGIQTLGLSPFVPDRQRTLVDFYEVLSFLPDNYFDKTHSSAEEVRVAEEHFITTYPRVMHMCADEISTKLAQKYDTEASIVSVTEYMEEPTYHEPPRGDGTIRLVYGGCMLATTNPDDLYYKAFVNVVPHFTRDNLHLYVYNSPYVHGLVENDGLKAVIQRLGLKNIHACKPLELDAFAREISTYDYGVTLLRPKDMEAVEYNYFMATKVPTYLRAGLPVVIDADNRFMAGLIDRYNIGLVLSDHDLPHLADILNAVDLPALKQNVVRFRHEFSIDKGGAKILRMYHDILEQCGRRRLFPAGGTKTGTPEPARERVRLPGPVAAARPHIAQARPKQEDGLTIFAMPKAFEGHTATIQKNAIRSWARLEPAPEILLFGDEPGIREMAAEVGARHIPQVERNEFGTPLVNKLFEAAEANASHPVLAYVNADMILFQSFAEGVRKVQAQFGEFLLIGQRWDLPVLEEIDFRESQWPLRLQKQMEEHAMLHAECGLDYFVFPRGLYREVPPFAIGRTAWDNWLVMAPHTYGAAVVDGTEFITAVHQDHDYGHVAGGRDGAWTGAEAAHNRELARFTDNSGRTSGATWALDRLGRLVRAQPRQPWYLTTVYRDERAAWLLRQADRLMAAERLELAGCKWEEALVLLDALLGFCRSGQIRDGELNCEDIARRYATCCTRLAQCCLRMHDPQRSAGAYSRLLEHSAIEMSKSQREELTNIRDELLRVAREGTSSCSASGAGDTSGSRTVAVCEPGPLTESSGAEPPLQAGIEHAPEHHEPHGLALAALEENYRQMPDGTRAKYAMAVRLSDVFRRAGLTEKSRAFAAEAKALRIPGALRASQPEAAQEPVSAAAQVTVITTCRNGEDYLAECLDSILNQTMSQWRLFLLDDGSTDGTRGIIQAYAARDARIKPFYFDDTSGPYVRRNFAIRRAQTPFVMIHDGDDIMYPEKLQRLYEAIGEDERLGLVGSFYRMFLGRFNGTEHTEAVTLLTRHEDILAAYTRQLLWDFSWHGSLIVRRTLFDEIGLYDENPFGADSFWLAKAAEYARHTGRIRLRNIPEFLTLRRVHDNSQTGLLPTMDPRGRRARYWRYCLCRLRETIARVTQEPHADVARRLRECTCGDFLRRFSNEIVEWEKQPLDERVLPHFLHEALQGFHQRRYVTCLRILNGLEIMESAVAKRVPNFDLVRALSLYGLGQRERCQTHLRCEIVNHSSPIARRFHVDVFERGLEVDLQAWCAEQARFLSLRPMEVVPTESTPAAAMPTGGTPKVTVVTACRNAEPFLAECLDSILAQTFGDWELFLLDDGSTDGTRRTMQEYQQRDRRIQVHCFDDHKGPYVRRNFAIERARTEFIVIHDADDIMCPTKLATLCAEISGDERLAMVGAGYRTFLEQYRGPQYSEYNRLPLAHDEIIERFRSWQHGMSHGSAIIRKSLFTEIGPYDENPFASDSFWSAKLALYAEAGQPIRIKSIPECLTLIRMHAANHTRVLSTLDPRNRRTRYRKYCECKLRRIRDRLASEPGMDIASELRRCTCSDFLTRFQAQIIAWENEPLDARVVPEYLQSAVSLFNQGYYVSCANILNGVEAFEPTIRDRVMGYDLLRGMARYALRMTDAARECLDREIRSHENPTARRFVQDAFESAAPVDVSSWCRKHAERFPVALQEARPPEALETMPSR